MIQPKPLEEVSEYLEPGTKLLNGQYTIQRFLNVGGFGITYLATDSLERDVVIKECYPGALCRRENATVGVRSRAHENQFAKSIQLFLGEAQSLAKLKHPNIVGVHQVFQDNQTAYMVLDYIEGYELLDVINDKKAAKNIPFIVTLVEKILHAIKYMHENGILHRDISPDNILIGADGEPILIDFGAARVEAVNTNRVLSTLSIVKDGYSPQEFYLSGSHQNESSDLYAFGASVYHYISDELSPNSQLRLAARAEGKVDPYYPLAGRFKGYPNNFLSAIDKSINLIPKERFQSAAEWLDVIDPNTKTGITGQDNLRAIINENTLPVRSNKKRNVAMLASLLIIATTIFALKFDIIKAWQSIAAISAPVVEAQQQTVVETTADKHAIEETARVEAEEEIVMIKAELAATKEIARVAEEKSKIARIAVEQEAKRLADEAEAAKIIAMVKAAKAEEVKVAAEAKAALVVAQIEAAKIIAEKQKQLADAFLITQDQWKFSLPFEWRFLSFGNTRFLAVTSTSIDGTGSAVFAKGDTIFKVNGTRIIHKDTMKTVMNHLENNGTSGQIFVDMQLRKRGQTSLKNISVPISSKRLMTLSNGMEIVVKQENETWETIIQSSPYTGQNMLLSGDIILSENNTGDIFDDPEKMHGFLTEIGNAKYPSLQFSILRNEQTININVE